MAFFCISWFSWFFPCSFSQNWWSAQTWTITYHIDFCHRRVTKKKIHKVLTWDSWDMWLSKLSIWPSSESYISAVPHQNLMNFFLVSLLWQKAIWYFMVHVWAPHHFWENEHGKIHENQKMPLSLASSSDVATILAMTHIDFLDLGVMATTTLILVDFQSNGA